MKWLFLILLSSTQLWSQSENKLHTVYADGGENKFQRITKNEEAIRELQKQMIELKKEIEKIKAQTGKEK